MLPVHLPGTIPLIGRLAPSPVKKRQDQSRPSGDATTFARNWKPRSDTNSSSRPNLKRIGSRNEENLADNDDVLSFRSHPKNAIPAWIEQQPQTTATHVSADLPPHSPTPPSARDQLKTENETRPELKQEIAPANGQVLESTAHARTRMAGAASAQRTEELSQRTLSQPTYHKH